MRIAPVIAAAFAALLTSPPPADATGEEHDSGEASAYPACIHVRAEVRATGVGYDHWVFISNDCDTPAACDVTTDVSPATLTVTVQAGETTELLTFRGSPARRFTPYVTCQLAPPRGDTNEGATTD